jgi:hypothetical protein
MAQAQVLSELQLLNQLLVNAKEATQDTASIGDLTESVKSQMVEVLSRHQTFAIVMATGLMKFIGKCALGAADRVVMIELIRSRISFGTLDHTVMLGHRVWNNSNTTSWSHTTLHKFFTRSEWETMRNPKVPNAAVTYCIVNRALKCHLTAVREHVYKYWSALPQLSQDAMAHMRPNASQGKQLVELLKSQLKLASYGRKTDVMMSPPPESPQQMLADFPEFFALAYPSFDAANPELAGPVEQPFDELSLRQLCLSLPARKSHHSIATDTAARRNTSSRLTSNLGSLGVPT